MWNLLKAGVRRLVRLRAKCFRPYRTLFAELKGLEIGGPSGMFGRWGLFPLYPVLRELDNCTFSATTIWEHSLEGKTYRFDKSRGPGSQFTGEATSLAEISSETYDVILASHVLEHVANPIKALNEWMRVLRPEGFLVLILPHLERTFDHRRPVTQLKHLIEDFHDDVSEDDLTHLSEVLEHHDLEKDPHSGGRDQLEARSRNNIQTRSMHHHVFTTSTAIELVGYVKFEVLAVELLRPYHILIVARKPVRFLEGETIAFRGDARFRPGIVLFTPIGRIFSQ